MSPTALAAHHALAGSEKTPAEFDLICALAGVDLTPVRAARAAGLVEAGVDWAAFLRMAEHHGVLPLMARNLGDHTHSVPPEVMSALRKAFTKNLQRNLWFTGETVRIVDHLRSRGIKAVPYKGPMLAETAYGDVALRNFGDMDFLIAPGDFLCAKEALAEIGYWPSKKFTPAEERFWLRRGYECSFDGEAGKYLVELQWRFLPQIYAVDLRTEELLDRAREALLAGKPVLTLSPEDTLLVLCLHAAKHLWMRLIWVCDIAETMRTQSIDYEVVAARAQTLGVARVLGVSLWLANRLLGSAVPKVAEEIAARDSATGIIVGEIAARLARGARYDLESTEYFRWILKLRERRLDRYRYLWRLVWTPGAGDLSAVRLPAALFPLYRAVRVLRLVRKLG